MVHLTGFLSFMLFDASKVSKKVKTLNSNNNFKMLWLKDFQLLTLKIEYIDIVKSWRKCRPCIRELSPFICLSNRDKKEKPRI